MSGPISNDWTKKQQHLWFKLTYCQICLQDVGMLLYPFISVALFQDLVRNLTLLDLMGVKADTKPLLNVRNLKKFTLYLYTYVTFTEMCWFFWLFYLNLQIYFLGRSSFPICKLHFWPLWSLLFFKVK